MNGEWRSIAVQRGADAQTRKKGYRHPVAASRLSFNTLDQGKGAG